MSKNLRNEVIEKINSSISYIVRANNMLYRGKVYILGRNIYSFYKTKRGAEGENKRLGNISYYYEYSMEMVTCGGYEVFEILENEIADINSIKTWYNFFKNEYHHIYQYSRDKEFLYNAEEYVTNEETLKYIKESIKDIMTTHSFSIIDKYEEIERDTEIIEVASEIDVVETVQEEKTQEVTNTIEESNNADISVEVVFNAEKNGIELHFSDKPSQEVLNQIKANGFRYSKFQKMWYCKDSEEKREFLKSIGLLNSSGEAEQEKIELKEVKAVEYPEIDINDIESYTVSKELSDRENSISMFRKNNRDHTKEIQNILQSMNDDVIDLINKGCNAYIEYKAKDYLQRTKKKYYDLYIKMLNHKANNPSWAVTGRGGLNVDRYNKKASQYDKMIGESSRLIDEFNSKIESFKNQIRRENKAKTKKDLEELKSNVNINDIKFIRKKSDMIGNLKLDYTCTVYEYNHCFIVSNYWGKFRLYKDGKELTSANSLEDAKLTLIALIGQQEAV